jgi:hypothetical protein
VGLILDSSVAVVAERQSLTVVELIEQIVKLAGQQDAALSSVGLTELVHGIYRATNVKRRDCRRLFIEELLRDFTVYPYTKTTAMLAGKIDGEQRAQGITVPFADLLIGATALSLGFAVLTVNVRHFRLIPNLQIIQF